MSKIEWTDLTQNPIKERTGGNYCVPCSPGCGLCYASVLNAKGTRFGGNGRPFGVRPEGHPEMVLNTEMIRKWARMRKPKKHFVGSMTDIFGGWISDWMIFTLLDAMAVAPLQTFQMLTKRIERACVTTAAWLSQVGLNRLPDNIWLGTSAEDQKRFDERLIWLVRTKAAVRFLSLEPLLGPIEFPDCDPTTALVMEYDNPLWPIDCIDWVIVGGESGSNARLMNPDWVLDILQQCQSSDIPTFVKQMGSAWAKTVAAKHQKGGDPDEWPEQLRIRMMPGEEWK